MKVAVWDTYVTKKDGTIMHFDIIVPEEVKRDETVFAFGNTYLETKGQSGQPLTSTECSFCHIQRVKPDWENSISLQGYYIYEMENCS